MLMSNGMLTGSGMSTHGNVLLCLFFVDCFFLVFIYLFICFFFLFFFVDCLFNWSTEIYTHTLIMAKLGNI